MKNDELDRLKDDVAALCAALPPLMVDGYGKFREADGHEVSASLVLHRMTTASDAALRIRNTLDNQPPRKVAKKEPQP